MRLPASRTVSEALEAPHIKLAELAATEVGILQRYKPCTPWSRNPCGWPP
jgi:hypothetical protein